MNRTLHPKASEYTFFSSAPRMFSRTDHSFTQRTNVSTFKKTEVISNIFFLPKWYETKNEIQEENWKTHKNMEIKREKLSRHSDKWQPKYDILKYIGHSKSSSEREVHSNKGLPQGTRKTSNKRFVHLKDLEEQMKPRVTNSRRRDPSGNKSQSRNKVEAGKTIEKIDEPKSWFFEKKSKIDKALPRLTKKKKKERVLR